MKKSKKNKLLVALGVGVGAYVLFSIVQRSRSAAATTNLPQQYPGNYQPQDQKGKGLKTAVDIIGTAATLADTLFGKGGPLAKNKTA